MPWPCQAGVTASSHSPIRRPTRTRSGICGSNSLPNQYSGVHGKAYPKPIIEPWARRDQCEALLVVAYVAEDLAA
jgi:hypothetical protein